MRTAEFKTKMKTKLFLFMALTFNANAMNTPANLNYLNTDKQLARHYFTRRLNSDALKQGELAVLDKKTMQAVYGITAAICILIGISKL